MGSHGGVNMPTGIYKRTKQSANLGKHRSVKTEFKTGHKAPPHKEGCGCPRCTGFKGYSRQGKEPWNKGKKSWVKPWLGKKRANISGEKHPHWKGGVTPINLQVRHSLEYKLWRRAVFERDNFMCVNGGKDHGSKLEADHIKEFADYPELRFAIDNGITLCKQCHRLKTANYLKKNWKNQYQLERMIN